MRSFVEAVKYAALEHPEAGFVRSEFSAFWISCCRTRCVWYKAAEKFKNVRQSTSYQVFQTNHNENILTYILLFKISMISRYNSRISCKRIA
jgi:hypothetical protein